MTGMVMRPIDFLAGEIARRSDRARTGSTMPVGAEGGTLNPDYLTPAQARRMLSDWQNRPIFGGGEGWSPPPEVRIQNGYLQMMGGGSDAEAPTWQNYAPIVDDTVNNNLRGLASYFNNRGLSLNERGGATYNNAQAIDDYVRANGGYSAFGFDPAKEWANHAFGKQVNWDQFNQLGQIEWEQDGGSLLGDVIEMATPLAIMAGTALGGSALFGPAAGAAAGGAAASGAAGGAGAAGGSGLAAGMAIPELGLIANPATASAAIAGGIPASMLAGGTGAIGLGALYGPTAIPELGMVADPATASSAIQMGIPTEMLAGGPGALSLGVPTLSPVVNGATNVGAAGAAGSGSVFSNPAVMGALGGGLLGGLGGSGGPAGTTTTEEGIPDWLMPYVKPTLDKYSTTVQNYNTDPYGVMPSAMQEFQKTLQGNYLDPSTNKWLEQYYKLGAERIKGTIAPSFGHMQAFGSHSGYNEALSRGLADFSVGLYGGNYQKERDRQSQMTALAPSFLTGASQSAFAPYQGYLNTVGSLGKKTQQPYFQGSDMQNILGGAVTGWGLGNLFK
jgi:hypothetical protein